MKKLKLAGIILSVVILWSLFVGLGLSEGFLLRPFVSGDSSQDFVDGVLEKLDEVYVGNFAMIMVEDGEFSDDLYFSVGQEVDENSSFPVASISKWVTSFGVMKLVQQGKIDLDTPVDEYLTRWNLPPSDYDNREVTVRRLLSHSAGLTDDLGYGGFAAGEKVQTIEESLTNASDGYYEGAAAKVGYQPGSQYMYSGASYLILQLLIEEISGKSFQTFMDQEVFEPLGMKNTTFDLEANPGFEMVDVYTVEGETRPFNRFTAMAAAALVTSASDLMKFMQASVTANSILSQETIQEMSSPESFINGTPVYGLGPHLYSQNSSESNIIGHDGSGNNAINTAARVDLMSGDGIIILETGNYKIASNLADEWMFWKAGIADFVVITRNKNFLITLLLSGYALILIGSIYFIRRKKTLAAI